MASLLNFGVIGTNWITNSFVQSAHESKKFKLVAVYSRRLEAAQKFVSETPSISDASSVKTYEDLDALLSDKSLDVVYIASPNSLHYAQGIKALNAGKHVIVEKPFASNLKEFDELCKLADSKGLFVLEAYRHIQEPNFLKLQALLNDPVKKAEKFGPIYGASVNMAVYSSRYAKVLEGEEPNVLSPKFSGGSLWDMGCYPIMFTLALFGKPVSQAYHPVIIRTGVDGGGHIIMSYSAEASKQKEKFTVHAHTSKIYTSTAPTEIYCEKGTIRVNGATGVTDINTIEFVPSGSKDAEQLADTNPEYTGMLNLTWEAKELGRIVSENDREAESALRSLSRDVLETMEDLRRQNGIVFASEQ
ncbi:NAD(P)-binding protein [Cryphonectria parasitica EP155]|uniref:NAD(P)-binding protein n=1 Tax=Cryphonectria parasitica (strain ATCC 38755 / EP155) TaxID=660469 RepID=A0A9P4XWT1_CRYP1|nr:NAD(P)-binding protein [Cryphonectria parasitica EP155]KAF3762015.1 NAD(P)-binding protein [Cryphonectria parasitica EP155]